MVTTGANNVLKNKGLRGFRALSPVSILGGDFIDLRSEIPYETVHEDVSDNKKIMETRNVYFDNAKFILIFLVVLGHFTDQNRSIPIIGALNNVIYSFHMPLFVFISGYFSRKIKSQSKSDIDKILYIYIVFEVLNYLFTKFTSFGVGSYNIFTPTYQNWYILGVFIWRLLIPYFNFYPKKYSFVLIFIFSIIIGMFNNFNTFLGLYRILYFMPVFVLGYYTNSFESILDRFKKYKLLFTMSLVFFLLAIFGLSIYNPTYNNLINFAYTPWRGYGNNRELSVRILGLVTSWIISFFILFIIPYNNTFFTKLGKRTMNVFLLHMFLVFPLNFIFIKLNLTNISLLGVCFLASLSITFILSLNFVNQIMKPLTSLSNLLSLTKNKRH
jgi:fucose 4-O-acetylase-like acetyltransferase